MATREEETRRFVELQQEETEIPARYVLQPEEEVPYFGEQPYEGQEGQEEVLPQEAYFDEQQHERQEVPLQQEDVDAEMFDEEDELMGANEDGQQDQSLLRSFNTHIASKIWKGEAREDVLKCQCHTSRLWEWDVAHNSTKT